MFLSMYVCVCGIRMAQRLMLCSIAWPARSPDLTPLDFFLWGRIKDLVYATAPITQEDMRQRIIDACASINVEELYNVQASLIRKFQWCLDENGGHFEHLHH